jgi:AcrR family transcriptional regulator
MAVKINARPCASEFRMTRKYTLRRRAEQQAETRQRIVEAALDLHSSVGPARTSFSMVAERAGVQRHTLYAHFPDERSLFLACSGHNLEVNPPPDAASWSAVPAGRERLTVGLGEIYAWYERKAAVTAHVMRDVEINPALREIVQMRRGPLAAAWRTALGEGLGTPEQAAMLALALSFHTWRTLARDAGLGSAAAAEIMAAAIVSAER